MRNKNLVAAGSLAAMLATSIGFAGTATFTGTGRASAEADYVEVKVEVTSDCYSEPREAALMTDALAGRVADFARERMDMSQKFNEVYATPDFTRFQENYVNPKQEQTTCAQGYKKQSTVVVKSANGPKFEELFNDLQTFVFAELKNQDNVLNLEVDVDSDAGTAWDDGDDGWGDDEDSDDDRDGGLLRPVKPTPVAPVKNFAKTTVDLGSPTPRLSHKTSEKLERQALRAAQKDTEQKFAASMPKDCRASHVMLDEVEEMDNSYAHKRSYARMESSAPDSGAQVSFDKTWVTKRLRVKYLFEGGHCED